VSSLSLDAVANRLNELLAVAFGGNVTRFAEAVDFPRGGLYKYLNAQQGPGRRLLEKINAAGGNPTYILAGEGDLFADNEAGRRLRAASQQAQLEHRPRGENIIEFRNPAENRVVSEFQNPYSTVPKRSESSETPSSVPLVAKPVQASDAPPDLASPNEWIDIGAWLSAGAGTVFCVRAEGPEMIYDDISEGEMLVVDRASPVVSGAVVVVSINGQLSVKRVEMRDSGMYLLSRPESDVGLQVAAGMRVTFWGTVQFVVRDMRAPPRKNKPKRKRIKE
jgi:DNA polymerase V